MANRFRDDVPQRFSKVEYKKYQDFIKSFEICQVCDVSTDLDTPHHSIQGSNKDDRSLICICIECHTILHTQGYNTLKKSRMQLQAIGKSNWSIYNER